MGDQADGLRRMVIERRGVFERARAKESFEPVPHRGKMVVVTSGKGGVGKTSLSVNLAVASAMMGRRVLLVDADLGLANVDIMLGLRPRFTLSDVLAGRAPFSSALLGGPAGIRILPGASGVARMANMGRPARRRLIEGLKTLAASVDLMVVDTGAGVADGVIRLAAAADEVVIVSTPEATAVTDAYATLKLVWQAGGAGKCWVWMNMALGASEGDLLAERIADVARRFLAGAHVGRLSTIEDDPAVRRAVRLRTPFVVSEPASQAARKVALAARAIQGRMSSPSALIRRIGRMLAG